MYILCVVVVSDFMVLVSCCIVGMLAIVVLACCLLCFVPAFLMRARRRAPFLVLNQAKICCRGVGLSQIMKSSDASWWLLPPPPLLSLWCWKLLVLAGCSRPPPQKAGRGAASTSNA